MKTAVQCPSESCGIVFEPHERWLGRNMYCPACGVRMTAKPLEVDAELERRVDLRGAPGSSVERLPLVVLVDNVRSLWNVGAIFRTADACGVRKLVLSGISGCPPRPEISKTALGAEDAVAWEYRADARRALQDLKAEGYHPVALENSPRAVPLDDHRWAERVCLVVGNEVAGVSPPLLEACRDQVSIPMRGVKASLNVAVAFGIAAHRAASVLAGRAALSAGLLLALVMQGLGSHPAAATGNEAPSFPRTLEKVWYRTASGRSAGDLTITPDTLEFFGKKRSFSIPFSAISMISLGKMQGDLNNDWVVLALDQGETRELVGIRDGRKLGYGQRTEDMAEVILTAARRYAWAQFRAPPEFEAYSELDHVFAMGVPRGWSSYHHELVSVGSAVVWGTVVFTPRELTTATGPPASDDETKRDRALAQIQSGELTAWVVHRMEAVGGMSCDGFSDKAQRTLGSWIANDPFFAEPFQIDEPPRFESTTLGPCAALRLLARSGTGGEDPLLDLRVGSHNGMAILVGLRSTAARYATDVELFARALATFEFAVARP